LIFYLTNLNFKFSNLKEHHKTKTINEYNKLRIDYDKEEHKINNNYIYPLLSCITYCNDNSGISTILTNIDLKKYKYKLFEEENKISMGFHKKYNHICFDGSKYYGFICKGLDENSQSNVCDSCNSEQIILNIRLWDKKPMNINYYENKCSDIEICSCTFSLLPSHNNEIVVDNKLTYSFYESLLYKNEKLNGHNSINLVENANSAQWYTITDSSIKTNEIPKYDDFEMCINDIVDTNVLHKNRFLQRFIYEKIYNHSICEWVILESEKYANLNGGWLIDSDKFVLSVDKINSIFHFILSSFKDIFIKITKGYCIPSHFNYNIKNLLIIKYNSDLSKNIKPEQDNSLLNINIILNSDNYEGGGKVFEDRLLYSLNEGDILVHSNKHKYYEKPVTFGNKYIIKCLIDIDY
jgi:hypothetical protein